MTLRERATKDAIHRLNNTLKEMINREGQEYNQDKNEFSKMFGVKSLAKLEILAFVRTELMSIIADGLEADEIEKVIYGLEHRQYIILEDTNQECQKTIEVYIVRCFDEYNINSYINGKTAKCYKVNIKRAIEVIPQLINLKFAKIVEKGNC